MACLLAWSLWVGLVHGLALEIDFIRLGLHRVSKGVENETGVEMKSIVQMTNQVNSKLFCLYLLSLTQICHYSSCHMRLMSLIFKLLLRLNVEPAYEDVLLINYL